VSVELPARAFFRYRVALARRPRGLAIDGRLGEWGDETLLPDLGEMEGRAGFARVHAAFDEAGLTFALAVANKRNVSSHRQRPHSAEALFLWIDTRDVHDVHRATRFCHHFIALPRGGGEERKGALAWQAPIRRATKQAAICEVEQLQVASHVAEGGYGLELAIPAAALFGYDLSECPRLGFTYLVTDHEHGWQTWSAPGGMPFDSDPSTWGTLDLSAG
jgi:hypothetical protein